MQEKIKNSFDKALDVNYITLLKGIAVGIFAGLSAILFRAALMKSSDLLHVALSFGQKHPIFIPIWFIILLIFALLTTLLLKWEPFISGSGIPQVEGELYGYFEQKWWRVLFAKFLGGILTIGSGLALGREGPSVQLGAMAGKGISKIGKSSDDESRLLITCGASAGLAAAFNAPLAGVIFAIEELHKRFSLNLLLSSMTSCFSAAFLSRLAFGQQPVFNFQDISVIELKHYWIVVILGIVLGLFGKLYQICVPFMQGIYDKIQLKFIKTAIPFVLAGIIGFICPMLLGGGNDIIASISAKTALSSLIILLIARFVFSILSFCSGVPGGIFLPLLTLGAICGAATGNVFDMLGLGFGTDNYIMLGMAGYFSAVVRSPITGILLICEMTGSAENLLPLMLISLIAYVTAGLLKSEPIYDTLLNRMLSQSNKKAAEN